MKPLGSLTLHPLTHGGLLLLTIAMSDVFVDFLPLSVVPPLFLRAIVLLLGGAVYWGLIQNRHAWQKHWGSFNLRVLELWTIVIWWVFWSQLGQGLLWLCDRFGLAFTSWPVSVIWGLRGLAVISFVAFPWLIDRLLQWQWQVKPLDPKILEKASPEAVKLLRSFFATSRRVPLPTLGIIPSPVPLCFGYGWLGYSWLPYRIFISQGVLDQLSPEEIAGLYALEVGYLQERSSWVLPWLVFLSQVPYLIYWFFATWGDRFAAGSQKPQSKSLLQRFKIWGSGLVHYLLGVSAAISYGLFRVLRFLLLPLARQRCYYGDRLAAALTGNPNAYSRALLNFAQLQTTDLETRGFTHPWLESLELLLPVGYTSAHTLTQTQRHLDPAAALAWDTQSPYRHWLSLNSPHPPTGDRLYQLQHYAQRWGLPPELPLAGSPQEVIPVWPAVPNLKQKWSLDQGRYLWTLLTQALPYTGLFLGLGLGLSLWFLSALANLWGLRSLAWILGNTTLLQSCLPLGFALGILLRHNSFFPNLPRRLDRLDATLYSTLSHPDRLPLQGHAIQDSGTLLGRSGLKNWLGQDLWLQSAQGIVRLHYSGVVGVATALWPGSDRPAAWMGRTITVSGWMRRGATLWLDVISLSSPTGFRIKSFPGVALIVLAGGLLWWSYSLFLKA